MPLLVLVTVWTYIVLPQGVGSVLWIPVIAAIYNGLAVIYLRLYGRRGRPLLWPGEPRTVVHVLVILDLIILAIAIYVTGGIESILVPAYLVYLPATSVIQPPRTTFAYASLALALLTTVFGLEYAGLIPHHPSYFSDNGGLHRRGDYVAVNLGFQATFLFTSAYITKYVASRLRRQRDQVLDAQALSESIMQEQISRRDTIAQLSHRISSILELDQLLQETVTLVREAFDYYSVAVLLVDEAAGELELRANAERGNVEDRAGYRQRLGEGIIGWVARNGQPLLSNDVRQEPRYVSFLPDTRSELCVPLKYGNRVLGVLDVQSDTLDAFNSEDVVTMQILADQIAIAIENARLYAGQEEAERMLRRRAEELSVLHRAALAGAEATDEDDLIERVTKILATSLYQENGGFLFLEPEADQLRAHPSYYGIATSFKDLRIPLGEGIVGTVAQTGEPILVPDVSRDPRYIAVSPTVKSELCVPARIDGEVVGVINVESPELEGFSREDVDLVSTIAGHVGTALGKLRLLRDMQRRNEELAARNAIARAISRSLDVDEVLEQLYREVEQLLAPDTFFVALLDEEGQAFDIALAVEQGEKLPPLSANLDEEAGGLTAWVIRESQPLLVRDLPAELDDLPAAPQHFTEPAHSWLGVPLVTRGRVIGVLSVQSFEPNAFDNHDEEFLTAIADQAAVIIDNAQLYAETRRMAITDGLTGLYNSHYFYHTLDQELARSERYGHPVSLIMFDLDDFKKYNDRYGHLAGDNLLRELGAMIGLETRKTDLVARYGGEEFVIILPETTAGAAAEMAERLRQAVERHEFTVQNGNTIGQITISVGVAACPRHAGDVKGLVHCADMALLRAKSEKNTVCVFEDERSLL